MTFFEGLTPPYQTLVVDPPWAYRRHGIQGDVADQYSTLTGDQIANLPVGDLAGTDAHLYLWATVPKLWDAPHPAEIAAAWGFTYKTLLTWVKGERVGLGWYYRVDTEHVLFCTRGKAPIAPELRSSSVLWSPRGAHSAKPPAFFDLVEKVSPGPRAELFCRQPRFGWDHWGHGYETETSRV